MRKLLVPLSRLALSALIATPLTGCAIHAQAHAESAQTEKEAPPKKPKKRIAKPHRVEPETPADTDTDTDTGNTPLPPPPPVSY